LPEVENCPYVILDRAEAKYTENNQLRDIECEIFLFICIYQEDITDDGRGVIYKGVEEIDSLAQLIRQEVSKKKLKAPVMWTDSVIPSVSESAPLRRYPIYMQLEKATIKLRERRET